MLDQTPQTFDDMLKEKEHCEAATKESRLRDGIPVDAILENGQEVTDPVRAAELVGERHAFDHAHMLYRAHIDMLRKPMFDSAEHTASLNPYRDLDREHELASFRALLNAGIVAINSAVSEMEMYWRYGGDPKVVEFLKSLDVREAVSEGLTPICDIRDALDRELVVLDQMDLDERHQSAEA